MKQERIYVEQYEGWWSFTASQWHDFVRAVIADAKANPEAWGWCLPNERQLKHRPRDVRRFDDTDKASYMSVTGRRVLRPLDWELEDWEYEQQYEHQ